VENESLSKPRRRKNESLSLHKGRGKFKILNDKCSRKYVGKIVDASDVIYCRIDS
jgi:hypothetical protein